MKRWFALVLLLALGSVRADNIVKTVVDGETILAADWNAEFLNIYADVTHTIAGTWTFTKAGTPITLTPASAPAANTILFDINNTSGTNLLSIDYEGDSIRAGTNTWTINDSATAATTTFETQAHTSTGTAAASFGIRNLYQLEDASGNTDSAAALDFIWTDATHGSEDADSIFSQMVAGTLTETLRVKSTGTVTIPTGATYQINGTNVLSATTLGTGVVTSSLTAVGTIATGVWNGTVIGLTYGGTAKALTAANGGIVWSDADSFEILAAGSSGQILRSGGAATPAWSTATYPATAGSSNTILLSDGTNFINSTTVWPNAATSTHLCFASASNTISCGDADLTFSTDTLSATKLVSSTSISSPSHISTAAIAMTPAAGSSMTVSLSTTGDFIVNTTQLLVDTSSGFTGFGSSATTEPNGSGIIIYASDYPRATFRNTTTGDASGDGTGLYGNGSDFWIENRETNGHIIFNTGGTGAVVPDADNSINLGIAATQRWKDIYAVTKTSVLDVPWMPNKKVLVSVAEGPEYRLYDTGTVTLDVLGNGTVTLDPKFVDVVNLAMPWQATTSGAKVVAKTSTGFVLKGDSNQVVDWIVSATRAGFENVRWRDPDGPEPRGLQDPWNAIASKDTQNNTSQEKARRLSKDLPNFKAEK